MATPTQDAYGGEVQHVLAQQGQQGAVDAPGSTLPFTGLEVVLFVVVGLVLLVGGLVARTVAAWWEEFDGPVDEGGRE